MFKRLRNGRKGFSLVELIVVIAIMAVLLAVLAPALLQHVEKSRAQKDDSAMGEVVEVVKLAMAEQDVYDECLCYTVDGNKANYAVGEDETVWQPDGTMRGLTITFHADKNANKTKFELSKGNINEFVDDTATSFNGTNPKSTLGTMTSGNGANELFARVLAAIPNGIVDLTSQTYRNSEYTIFIKMGNASETVVVTGQWNGTNLPGNGSDDSGDDNESVTCTKNNDCKVTVYEDHLDGCPKKQGGGAIAPKASLNDYSWDELQKLAMLHLTADEYLNTYNLELGAKKEDKYVLVDYDAYDGFVFMFYSGQSAAMNSALPPTNAGGYAASSLKSNVVDKMYDDMPANSELKKVIKEVSISCNESANSATINTPTVHMFLPAIREVSATDTMNSNADAEGSTFDYFSNKDTEKENRNNIYSSSWWLRSVSNGSVMFRSVYNGAIQGSAAHNPLAVVPAFVVGENDNAGGGGEIVEPETCTKNNDCKVTVDEDHLDGCPMKQGGSVAIEKKDSLNDYTWAEIEKIASSDAILSDYNISIGDTKTDNGTIYYLVSDERSEDYDGLVFMFDSGSVEKMNNSNLGGYASADMLFSVRTFYTALMKDDLKDVMKNVTIYCNDGMYESDGSTADYNNQSLFTKLFVPSLREVSASATDINTNRNAALNAEGSTFDYFNTNDIIAKNNRKEICSSYWWLRSAYGVNGSYFWIVASDGSIAARSADESSSLVLAFVIGKNGSNPGGGSSVKPEGGETLPNAKNSLNAYSWSELQTLAKAGLTAEEYKNTYNLELGSKKDNTFILVDYDNYGGFVFMFDSNRVAAMNSPIPPTNNGGYKNSEMKATVDGTYSSLPTDLKNTIKEVTISCNDGPNAPTTIHTTTVHMFLPSVREVSATYGSANEALNSEGSTFDYFSNKDAEQTNRTKICSSSFWGLRSAYSGNDNNFMSVKNDGSIYVRLAHNTSKVIPAFVVG